MSNQVRTRFAPSPTGYMHIGNLRTALYSYLIAKINNGKFILRIEDTDQERYIEGATNVIFNTLKLAGLKHDEGPDIGGDFGPYIQSQRKHLYKQYAEELVSIGGAFRCFCSKERLTAIKEECIKSGTPNKYDQHCLHLSQQQIQEKLDANEPYVIRQLVPSYGETSFDDIIYGHISIPNNLIESQILLKSDGMPTYNFANVIDDHLMNITHVVRGSEYLSSTPKYNLIYKSFGWDTPTYIHLPPVMKNSSEKLSKRNGDASFEDLIAKGYLVDAVINYIALLGWSPGDTTEIFDLKQLEKIFSISGISKSPSIFDIDKLTWLNGEYIRSMTLEQFHQYALPYYSEISPIKNIDLMKVSALLKARTEVLSAIPEQIDFFAELSDYDIELYVSKKMKSSLESSKSSLMAAQTALLQLEDWNFDSIHDTLINLVQSLGVKNGQVLWPVRVSITGKQFTPGGAIEIAEILGKEETLKRIEIGIKNLQ